MRLAPLHGRRTVVDQPIPQRHRRPHIVLVVGRDPVQQDLLARRHVLLVLDDRACALINVMAALVVRQPFQILEAIGLHTRLQRVAGNYQ